MNPCMTLVSNSVGMSKSMSSPMLVWCMLCYYLNEALEGIVLGRLTKMPKALFMKVLLNAKLWDSSWLVNDRVWLKVPAIKYAVSKN